MTYITDYGHVIEHILRLRAAGMPSPDIAAAAGLSCHAVYDIRRRKPVKVRNCDAGAILAVTPVVRPRHGAVDATAARRQLQALARIGHTTPRVTAATGLGCSTLIKIRNGAPTLSITAAQRIAEAYDELSGAGGYSRNGITRAAQRGWVGPTAWTTETIGDPTAKPATGWENDEATFISYATVDLAIDGDRHVATELNRIERLHVVRQLTARKTSAADIADLIGTTARTIQRVRRSIRDAESAVAA